MVKAGHISSGPARTGLFKNPMYTGMLAAFAGAAIESVNLFAVGIAGIGIWLKIKAEEESCRRSSVRTFLQFKREVKV